MIRTNPIAAILLLVTFTLLVSTSSGCFIRNCPRGGKRSASSDVETRQCLSCMGSGVCVGPTICCGKNGCHMGTEASKVCMKENESLTPCAVPGESCGQDGNCVADGICCNSDNCSMDSACRVNEELKPELLTLLKRLLSSKRD